MGTITVTLPTLGDLNATEDPDILNTLTAIVNAINGGLDNANLTGTAGITAGNLADATKLGLTAGATVRRGAVNIAAAESTTSTTYTTLATPDRVSSVNVGSNGLMLIVYQALAKRSGGTGKAAIFLGTNQLKSWDNGGAPAVQEVSIGENQYDPLYTTGKGLDLATSGGSDYTSAVTTGMILGSQNTNNPTGSILVVTNLAAAAYDVSVQYKSSTGTESVTAKERLLSVWTVGF